MKETLKLKFVVTRNAYAGAFVRGDGSVGSDKRNDLSEAAAFKTRREAEAFIASLGPAGQQEYLVEAVAEYNSSLLLMVPSEDIYEMSK